MTTRNRRHQAARMAGLAASLALALTGCAAPDSPPGPTQTSQAPSASARPTATADRSYDDGTYTADGWYGSQPSRIGVTLTLADSRITAVQITTPATDPTSLDYQRRFAEAAPDAVIGKHIDDADVSRLAGASGTSEGFNEALRTIRQDAARR
jgi:uncharacterized protein with FMN-binding domain